MAFTLATLLERNFVKASILLAITFAVTAFACAGMPRSYADDGDPAYQRATLCTNVPDLEPVVAYAQVRWADASAGRVNMHVRVVHEDLAHEDAPEGCDGVVTTDKLPTGMLGWTTGGVVTLDPRVLASDDVDDIVAHEIGHLLLGDAYADTGHGPEHSGDTKSIMWYLAQSGEQEITADDAGRLP